MSFIEIFGELVEMGLIAETEPGMWMPTAKGVKITRKFLLSVLACPHDAPEDEDYILFRATEILADLQGLE